MKYELHFVRVGDNFTCRIEALGRPVIASALGFFPTKEASLADALRVLRKAGVDDKDIVVQ